MNRGLFSGSSRIIRNPDQMQVNQPRSVCALGRSTTVVVHTFCEFFDTNVIKQLYLFYDEFLLVDLDDECCASRISPCESEFAKRVFERLGDIDCVAGL